jgi:hypothetical protein
LIRTEIADAHQHKYCRMTYGVSAMASVNGSVAKGAAEKRLPEGKEHRTA